MALYLVIGKGGGSRTIIDTNRPGALGPVYKSIQDVEDAGHTVVPISREDEQRLEANQLQDVGVVTNPGRGTSRPTITAATLAGWSDQELADYLSRPLTDPATFRLVRTEVERRASDANQTRADAEERNRLLGGGSDGLGSGGGLPGGGGLAGTGGDGDSGIDPFSVGPYTRFLRARGLPITPGTTADRYQANFAQPLYNIWDMQQGLNAAEAAAGVDPAFTSFETAARDFGGRRSDLQSSANSVLSRLAGLGAEGRAQGELGFEREFDQFTGEPSGGRSDRLTSLIQAGLADRYGGVGASYIARNLGNYRKTYEGERLAGKEGLASTYFDYLRNRFGGF